MSKTSSTQIQLAATHHEASNCEVHAGAFRWVDSVHNLRSLLLLLRDRLYFRGACTFETSSSKKRLCRQARVRWSRRASPRLHEHGPCRWPFARKDPQGKS